MDTGSTVIGSAVADEQGNVSYLSEVEIRNDIATTMKARAKARRNRRNRNWRWHYLRGERLQCYQERMARRSVSPRNPALAVPAFA